MRSRPVDNPQFLEYQATILTCLAAAGLSILRFQGRDLGFLTMDYRAWPQEPWRLVTACLLHGSLLHLIFNLYWTFRFGSLLEPIFGSLAYVGILVGLGAGSMATEWAFGGSAVGLSGIGYGLFGITWALDRYTANYRGILDPRTTTMFAVWFLICIFATYTRMMPVANWAHGAGAVLGGLFGLSLSPYTKRRRPARMALAVLLPVIAVLSTVGRPYVNYSARYTSNLWQDSYESLQRGENERALDLLLAYTRRRPGAASGWHNLGIAYGRLGRHAEAMEAFRRETAIEAAGRAE